MTPTKYARGLNEKLAPAAESSTSKPKKRTPVKFSEGKYIFYTGGDMKHASEVTCGKMDLVNFLSIFFLASCFNFQTVKHGGNLSPEFDPNLSTHIVTDASIRPTLRALGLKALKDIPDHIPTVRWNWVLTVIGRDTLTKEEIDAKWIQGILPISQRRSHLSEKRVKRKLSRKLMTRDPAKQGARVCLSCHSSLLPLNLLRDNTSASVIQPYTPQGEVAADMIRLPPSPPMVVSVNHCLQLLLINVLTMKWSSVGEFDIDDSDGGETDNDLPHPIPKRVSSEVYFSRGIMIF